VDVAALTDTLTDTERLLWDAFPAGTPVDLTSLPDEHRRVRGEVISALLRGALLESPPGAAGAVATVDLRGATVTGQVHLAFAQVPHPLLLTDCELEQSPDFYWARADFIRLHNCRMPGFAASNVQVEKHLQLTGSTFDGEIKLSGARISGGLLLDGVTMKTLTGHRIVTGGDLILDGAKACGLVSFYMASVGGNFSLDEAVLRRPGQLVLEASSMTVAGGCFARRGRFDGEVTLRYTRVQGAVTLSGSTLEHPDGVALRVDRTDIEGGLWLLGPARVTGRLSMVSARIGRILVINDAVLHNPGAVALDATGTQVQGAVDANGLQAEGTVKLCDVNVTGPVRFQDARLSNPDGVALNADGVRAGSIMDCCEGFTADGHLTFGGAVIGGGLCFNRGTITSLRGRRLETPELTLLWTAAPAGLVDLSFARVGVLRDDPQTWPARVRLDGLAYEALEPIVDIRKRLRLLERDVDGYRPQPYEQLAATSRRLGHDDEARSVLMAKQRRRTAGAGWVARWWGRLQDITVGYGYRPLRAAGWLALALTIGSIAFGLHPPDRLDPASTKPFEPVTYTLDVLLPLVELGQQDAFEPRESGYRLLMYALMATGWILATTVAAGIARSVRRD